MHLLVEIKMYYSEMQCVENFKVNKCIFWWCWSSKESTLVPVETSGTSTQRTESHHNPDKLNSSLSDCLTSKEMIVKSAELIKKMHILQET